ncbi:hypothetical protein M3683_11520 [Metabacillus halosaccharovorans]|uniref:CPCC family cysteine-rich protein n=1 Tax=Metabacillus halosaccharovorans TaxID=930124 RepID=UPI00203AFE60|nr:CPCC family cysteine-rich protein [Metabacillus halosaccharovorans]MCM3441484.1 hypothetical protein [Metabacillus halosaccharovorans]
MKTLNEEPPDTYQICRICFWEDDGYQYKFPDETAASYVSFREAQQNFMKFGAIHSL